MIPTSNIFKLILTAISLFTRTFLCLDEFSASAYLTPRFFPSVNIQNCVTSLIDNNRIERCIDCKLGLTKSFDMTSCFIAVIEFCIWQSTSSQPTCLECSCGYILNYEMTKCLRTTIQGCLRLDSENTKCIQPKIGYSLLFSNTIGTNNNADSGSVIVDNGRFCGWRDANSPQTCLKCHPGGFFLTPDRSTCHRLPFKLQNDHMFFLASSITRESSIDDFANAIQLLPGWDTASTVKTNAGTFENEIENCILYNYAINQFDDIPRCQQCSRGFVPTLNLLACVEGHFLCMHAHNAAPFKCAECIDRDHYYIQEIEDHTSICVSRDHFFDNCSQRSLTANECLECYTQPAFVLNSDHECIPKSGCTTSNGTNECLECNSNLTLMNGECIFLSNCETATSETACTECQPGFFLNDSNTCSMIFSNCLTMSSPTTCSECKSPFHLNMQDSRCYLQISFCEEYQYHIGQLLCSRCATMYTPNISGQTCLHHNLEFQAVCSRTDGEGNCLQCQSLYFAPSCRPITNQDLCLWSDGISDTCIRCYPNAIMNPDNICVQIDPLCLRTNGTNQCMQCQSGFYVLNLLYCVPVLNCFSSRGIDNSCVVCNIGHFRTTEGSCQENIPFCVFFELSNPTTCVQCQSRYFVSNGACQLMPNCLLSSGINQECFECEENFYLEINRQECTERSIDPAFWAPAFCTVFNLYDVRNLEQLNGIATIIPNFGLCLQCTSNRVPIFRQMTQARVDQVCITIEDVPLFINGCRVYSFRSGECMICLTGYIVVNNLCERLDNFELCLFSQGRQDSTNCLVCVPGVLLYQQTNICTIVTNGCQSLSMPCTECQYQHVFRPNPNRCDFYPDPLCETVEFVSQNIVCSSCKNEFNHRVNGRCMWTPHNSNCSMSENYQCTECNQGFVMVFDRDGNPYCLPDTAMADSKCSIFSSSGSCLQCENNNVFTFTENNLIYRECNQRHAQCNESNGIYCQSCSGGLFLDTTFRTNGCQELPNCVRDEEFKGIGCFQCATEGGYYIDGFQCNQIARCVESVDGIRRLCKNCQPMYFFSRQIGECIPISQNCSSGGGSSSACTTCHDPYFLYEGSCLPGEIENCIVYYSQDKCSQCKSGYQLTSSSGILCEKIPNCQTSNGISSACTHCEVYYILNTDNNECILPDSIIRYCRRQNGDTCLECEVAFIVVSGQCELRSKGRNDGCILYERTRNACELCQVERAGGVINMNTSSNRFGFCDRIEIKRCIRYQQNSQNCRDCYQNEDYLVGWLTPNQNFCQDVEAMQCLTMNRSGTQCLTCQEAINFPFGHPATTRLTTCNAICLGNDENMWSDELDCVPRDSRIPYCEEYHPGQNKCLICENLFVLSSDGTSCSPISVDNCMSNGIVREQKCVQCAPRYKLNASTHECERALNYKEIANCDSYINNSSLCSICKHGYYKSNFQTECLPATVPANLCKTFALDSDRCLKCIENYTLSLDGLSCEEGRSNTRCIVFSQSESGNECYVCENGYIAQKDSLTCAQDEYNFPGCRAVQLRSGDAFHTCSACIEEFYRFYEGVCIPLARLTTCAIEGCIDYAEILYDSAKCRKCIDKIEGSDATFVEQDGICVFQPARRSGL